MARYIDADKLKDAFHTDTEHLQSRDEHLFDLIMFEVDEQPTADVVEVKRGKWKRKGQDIYCSVCGNESAYNPFGASKFSDYCPNCGADMRGDGK